MLIQWLSKGLTWERDKALRKAAAENLCHKTPRNKEFGIPDLTPEPGKRKMATAEDSVNDQ